MLVPSVYLICAAFKRTTDEFTSVFLPSGSGLLGVAWSHLTTDNFRRLFAELGVLRPLANSLLIAGATSLLATLVCALAGYALMQFTFPGQQVLLGLVFACMVVPPVIILVPTYQELYWLHLLDTYSGLVLPYAAPAFGVLLFRQTLIASVPPEIIESGRIDGCSEARIFFILVLPFIRPMLAKHI
jgi:ABC-type glycerol-3-phosphate transport system permease component